jgi:hypothetical protein
MRTRMIVVAALCAALVFDAAWIWSGLAAAPNGASGATALHHWPVLVLAGLALYALVALLLTAATIILDTARVHSRLAGFASPNLRDWRAAFAATGMGALANRMLDLAPTETERTRTRIVVQSRFDPAHARREIGRLYSASLVRAQFVTALAVILVFAIGGFIRNDMRLAIIPAATPAAPALASVGVLVLLGVLGWIIVEAAAEPLIETIANLPFERYDIELLRRLGGIAEGGDAARLAASGVALSSAISKLLERLVSALDEGRSSLVDAIAGLSAQAEALTSAMQAAAQRGAEQGEGGADMAELRAAMTQLTALLDGLSGTSAQSPAGLATAAAMRKGEVAVVGASRSEISREVRDLLADLE